MSSGETNGPHAAPTTRFVAPRETNGQRTRQKPRRRRDEHRFEAWHLTFALPGRHPLAISEVARRAMVRALVDVAGAELVLYCVVDDHLHAVVLCSRQRAGRLTQAMTRTLASLAPGLAGNEPRPVEDRDHMRSLVPYVLTQVWRHEVVGAHPALWSGSCFQDLVGARVLPGLRLRIQSALPRLRLAAAFRAVGVTSELEPLGAPELGALGATRIATAAANALCVGPRPAGKTRPETRARRAAAQLSRAVGLTNKEVERALGITACGVRSLQSQPQDIEAQRALVRRLSLEETITKLAIGAHRSVAFRAKKRQPFGEPY